MLSPRLHSRLVRGFVVSIIALTSFCGRAHAWPWNSEPQPLLERNGSGSGGFLIGPGIANDGTTAPLLRYHAPVRADVGSPLAWDNSARVLWYVDAGALRRAAWTGSGFHTSYVGDRPKMDAGLLVDPGLHFVYFLNTDGQPTCLRRKQGGWSSSKMGDEQLQILLGVDEKSHRLFAYDSAAKGIRMYSYVQAGDTWGSEVIASGLGAAGDSGAVDAAFNTIYTTHETVDESVPRRQGISTMVDPSGTGLLKPWPLVATTWDGTRWSSRVIVETGVPQQPALRTSDRSVFFATRSDFENVQVYKPKSGVVEESQETLFGISGKDTFEDNDRYKIRAPQYPGKWFGNTSGGVIGGSLTIGWGYETWPSVFLVPPFQIVPYYEPIWVETQLAPRLTRYRAVVNPRQKRLVQHWQSAEGEVIKEQKGVRLVGYLYRDANGQLATRIQGKGYYFGPLGPEFDPQNPPAHFTTLDLNGGFFTTYTDYLAEEAVSVQCSTNPDSPFIPAYIKNPKKVLLRTFGHNYTSQETNQRGARYRDYVDTATSLAVPSSIAVDRSTGATFYTQAPVNYTQAPVNYGNKDDLPKPTPDATLSTFDPDPDPKLPCPPFRKVWIVMVY